MDFQSFQASAIKFAIPSVNCTKFLQSYDTITAVEGCIKHVTQLLLNKEMFLPWFLSAKTNPTIPFVNCVKLQKCYGSVTTVLRHCYSCDRMYRSHVTQSLLNKEMFLPWFLSAKTKHTIPFVNCVKLQKCYGSVTTVLRHCYSRDRMYRNHVTQSLLNKEMFLPWFLSAKTKHTIPFVNCVKLQKCYGSVTTVLRNCYSRDRMYRNHVTQSLLNKEMFLPWFLSAKTKHTIPFVNCVKLQKCYGSVTTVLRHCYSRDRMYRNHVTQSLLNKEMFLPWFLSAKTKHTIPFVNCVKLQKCYGSVTTVLRNCYSRDRMYRNHVTQSLLNKEMFLPWFLSAKTKHTIPFVNCVKFSFTCQK